MKNVKLGHVLTAFPVIYSFIALFRSASVADSIITVALVSIPLLYHWIQFKEKSIVTDTIPKEIRDLEYKLQLEKLQYSLEETRLHQLKQRLRTENEINDKGASKGLFTF